MCGRERQEKDADTTAMDPGSEHASEGKGVAMERRRDPRPLLSAPTLGLSPDHRREKNENDGVTVLVDTQTRGETDRFRVEIRRVAGRERLGGARSFRKEESGIIVMSDPFPGPASIQAGCRRRFCERCRGENSDVSARAFGGRYRDDI